MKQNAQKDKTLYNLRKGLAVCKIIVYNNTRQKQIALREYIKEGNHHEQGKHQEGRACVFGRS